MNQPAPSPPSLDAVLARLAETIAARRSADTGQSYTRQLLDAGPARCAKKFGEEAVELVIAATAQDDAAVAAEAADVLYHLLVLLEARNVPQSAIASLLNDRMKTSGLTEKAARSVTVSPQEP